MKTISYKCPNCGGGLIFNPAAQQFKCEFCNSEFAQQQLQSAEPTKEQSQDFVPPPDAAQEMAVYNCPSCGGEIVTDPTTAATFCYYCHNPVVLAGKLSGEYRPDYVLPFHIEREQAIEIFKKWVGKKHFVPRGFYAAKQIEKMTGVYYPYLQYSCRIDARLDAEGKTIKKWRRADTEYTETKVYKVRREGSIDIQNVTRNALQKNEHQLAEFVMPYDMTKVQPFSPGFLSGFVAENRNIAPEAFEGEVETEVKKFALGKISGEVRGYDGLSVLNKQAGIISPEWKYVLMPVWTITYRAKNDRKLYYFAINGQTGNTCCNELPVDNKRLMILFLCFFLPILIVGLIGGLLV